MSMISALIILAAGADGATPRELETIVVVRELEEVAVPARRSGLISQLLVRRGHAVKAEQLIAQLEKTDISLRMKVIDADVKRAAVESGLLAELGDNAVYLEWFRLSNQLEKSTAELRILEHDLKQTSVHSPVEGVVRKVLKHQGEWVRQGEPIAAITRMDKLIVEGFLDSQQVSPHAVAGARARVVIPLAGAGPVEIEGLMIEHSAPKLELDGKFPVWVEIKNPVVNAAGKSTWLIRPGMSGTLMVILP